MDNKLMKSKEEIDKAYLEWKKVKEQDYFKKKKMGSGPNTTADKENEEKQRKKVQAEKVSCTLFSNRNNNKNNFVFD